MSDPGHVRVEMVTQIHDICSREKASTLPKEKSELGRSVKVMNEALNPSFLAINIPGRKAKEVVVQPLLLGTFAV